MALTPERRKLFAEIKQEVDELIDPLDTVLVDVRIDGEDGPPEAARLIGIDLWRLGVNLAAIDGSVTVEECQMMYDAERFFIKDVARDVDVEQYRGRIMDYYDGDPLFREMSAPSTVDFLRIYDDQHGTNYADLAKAVFFQYANAFVKADGKITAEERGALALFKENLFGDSPDSHTQIAASEPDAMPAKQQEPKPARPLKDVLNDLEQLVGLQTVKNDVNQLVNFLKVQSMRKDKGLDTLPISRHLVFYGNPGTGI